MKEEDVAHWMFVFVSYKALEVAENIMFNSFLSTTEK